MSRLNLIFNSLNNLKKVNFEIKQVDAVMTILSRTTPDLLFNFVLEELWAMVSEARLEK